MRITSMIATSQLAYPSVVPRISPVRRRISPQAGQALEKLSHVIEYLTDELVNDGSQLVSDRGRMEAIELLMSINGSIYAACPEIHSLGQLISSWLRRAA